MEWRTSKVTVGCT